MFESIANDFSNFNNNFNTLFGLVSIIIPLLFIIMFGIIIFMIGRNIKQWHTNNRSPILTVHATVVAKSFTRI